MSSCTSFSSPMPAGVSSAPAITARSRRWSITEMQLSDALNRPQREVAIAHPGRCVHPLKHLSTGSIESLLDEAAIHRANLKAARWLKTADAHGRDAALFQSTAETLGYRGNSLAMRLLAQRAPLALLKAEGRQRRSRAFRHRRFPLAPSPRTSAARHPRLPPRPVGRLVEKPRPLRSHRRTAPFLGKPTASAPPTTRTGGSARWPPWSKHGRNTAALPSPGRLPPSRSSISSTRSTTISGRTATP